MFVYLSQEERLFFVAPSRNTGPIYCTYRILSRTNCINIVRAAIHRASIRHIPLFISKGAPFLYIWYWLHFCCAVPTLPDCKVEASQKRMNIDEMHISHRSNKNTHFTSIFMCTGSHCCSELRAEQTTPITSGLTPLTTIIRSDTKVGHASYLTNVHRRHKTQSQLNVGRTFTVSWNNWIVCNCITLIGAQSSFRGISNHGFCRRPSNHEFQTSNPIISRSWREKLEPFFKKDKVTNYVQEILNHQWKTISPQEINSQSLEDA